MKTIDDTLDEIDWGVDPAVDRATQALDRARTAREIGGYAAPEHLPLVLESIAESLIAIAKK